MCGTFGPMGVSGRKPERLGSAGRRARRGARRLRGTCMGHATPQDLTGAGLGTKLSPQAHQRLTEELAERTGPTRRHISELIERAREMGDLKENGDYHAAKNE